VLWVQNKENVTGKATGRQHSFNVNNLEKNIENGKFGHLRKLDHGKPTAEKDLPNLIMFGSRTVTECRA